MSTGSDHSGYWAGYLVNFLILFYQWPLITEKRIFVVIKALKSCGAHYIQIHSLIDAGWCRYDHGCRPSVESRAKRQGLLYNLENWGMNMFSLKTYLGIDCNAYNYHNCIAVHTSYADTAAIYFIIINILSLVGGGGVRVSQHELNNMSIYRYSKREYDSAWNNAMLRSGLTVWRIEVHSLFIQNSFIFTTIVLCDALHVHVDVIWFCLQKLKVVPVPKDQYGSFYSGDSYIVLSVSCPSPYQLTNVLVWTLTNISRYIRATCPIHY